MKSVLLVVLLCMALAPTSIQAQTPLPDIPGHIAYIGFDQNVHLLDLEQNARVQLTSDAGVTSRTARLYQWPTWSNDGRLAYFGTTITSAGSIALDVLITSDAEVPAVAAYSATDISFTYAAWSPRNCTESESCRDLAVLISDSEIEAFRVTVVRDDSEDNSFSAGTGAPFYFSWSPNGQSMVLHRDNSRVDTFDVSSREERVISRFVGTFFAPAWSPVDDRILIAVPGDSEGSSDLAIVSDGSSTSVTSIVEDVGNPVSFSWSPDGNRIAYLDGVGTLFVVDAVSGELTAGSLASGTLAFFWSPNSQHIAYVSLATRDPGTFSAKATEPGRVLQTVPGLNWSILDVESGVVRRYGSFQPTREMAYLLTYFDQFSQSHRIWSPDSRHIVYGELTASGAPVINVLDALQATTLPLAVAEGVVGVWSFE